MDELLVELEIPLYLRQYIKSNSIRPKYYQRGKRKVPDKYRNNFHGWKFFNVIRGGKKLKVEYLINKVSDERIICNSSVVGQQNIRNINGQDIYNGKCSSHDRNNLMRQIKAQFRKYVQPLETINRFPIRIVVYIFDTILDDNFSAGQDWDVDNRFFPYGKAFADILTQEGKIPDDNMYYITVPPHAIFVPVDDMEDRKLVIRIYKDNRPVILKNYLYQKKHGNNLH